MINTFYCSEVNLINSKLIRINAKFYNMYLHINKPSLMFLHNIFFIHKGYLKIT